MFENPVTWRKRGLVIKPRKDLWWMQSHASHPTVKILDGTHIRVYVGGRDHMNRSHVGYVELDVENPEMGATYSTEPALGLGELGTFDDNGVIPLSVLDDGEITRLYYVGWGPKSTVRFSLFSGLATSTDGGRNFQRSSRAPLLSRTDDEPLLNAVSCVMRDGADWHMWYLAGVKWIHADLPMYDVRYASSVDGNNWRRDGQVCIGFTYPGEHAIGRPWVIKEGDIFKMWFAHKGIDYRIGYAESEDGITWERRDELAGIDISRDGWDSEMIEYCTVFEIAGQKYMLYNGNNYGHGGVGLAVAE